MEYEFDLETMLETMSVSGNDVGPEVEGNTKPSTTPDTTKKHKGWSITINNPTDEDIENYKAWCIGNDKTVHACGQIEIGKEGTRHWQACFIVKNPVSFNPIKKRWPKAHIEPAKSYKDLAVYCKKKDTAVEGTQWEMGELPQQGRRTDLDALAESIIKDGKKPSEIAITNPAQFVKFHRGLTMLHQVTIKRRMEQPYIEWRFGKSGVGKTRYIYDSFEFDDIYSKPNGKWWDGYTGQKVILIDDFDVKTFSFREILKFTDRYEYRGETKGGYIQINSPYIFITCEHQPSEYWESDELLQVVRRIKESGGRIVHVISEDMSITL